MNQYHPRMSAAWWLKRRPYFLFMLREMTSLFIAAFLVLYLIELHAMGQGPGEYAAFLQRMRSPGWIMFHILAFVAAVYHSVTWFHLTPKAMVIRVGEERVLPILIAGANYVAWAVVSLAIAWVILGS